MIRISEILYSLFIRPITLLLEVLFSVVYQAVPIPLVALTVMSIAVNLLVLPLYKRADELQKRAREKEAAVRPWADKIKKAFSGDERIMMLQTYYREMGYSPLESLKSSVSLLLQIPFFIAAYRMISSLVLLNGSSAGPIKDLGMPDAMLAIGSMHINVLPILMTAINILSGLLFAKDKGLKDKLQLFITAGVFLVLLYNSPAGLVYYWTCNNIFSLLKNVVGLLHKDTKKSEKAPAKDPLQNKLFILCALMMSVFTGLCIPSDYLTRATETMLRVDHFVNPATYLYYSTATALGIFFVWCGIFFALSSHKKIMNTVLISISLLMVFNYFGQYTAYGDMTRFLTYVVDMPGSNARNIILSILATMAITILVVIVQKNRPKLLMSITAIMLLGFITFSSMNIIKTCNMVERQSYMPSYDVEPRFKLSSEGQNVVVVMLDRAQGCFFYGYMNENPDIAEQYEGFTYYSNCTSFGVCTNLGVPSLLGGYEYTPAEMNARSDEKLMDKHNEALLVMPTIFEENGYDVTLCNPTYANYMLIPDLSLFDGHPAIESYVTYTATNDYSDRIFESWDGIMKRDLFFYGLMFSCPEYVRPVLYDHGYYNDMNRRYSEEYVQRHYSASVAEGVSSEFIDANSALVHLADLTEINDNPNGDFIYLDTAAAHSPMLFSEPDYSISFDVDNTVYDAEHTDRFIFNGQEVPFTDYENMAHYQSAVVSYQELAAWFDYLKECGVYDNTRIIIVADHGGMMYLGPDSVDTSGLITSSFNPILLVKDFDSHEFTVSDEFMTNAETPYLATEGIIDNPVNPFTGNPLVTISEYDGDIIVSNSNLHNANINNGNTFLPDGWYRLNNREAPLNVNSWEYLGNW